MDRPIVLNSLLCFIHNYRDSLMPNQLKGLINKYFAKTAITCAYAVLLELLPPTLSTDPPADILCLYDRVKKIDQAPVFAAADLSMLPLTLITDEGDAKNELLREIRQLKRFIQDALNGKVDEPSAHCNSTTISNLNEQFLSTPNPSCKLNISASSPESPSSAGLFNTSSSSTGGAPSINSVPSPQNLTASPIASCINAVVNNSNCHSSTSNTGNNCNSNVIGSTSNSVNHNCMSSSFITTPNTTATSASTVVTALNLMSTTTTITDTTSTTSTTATNAFTKNNSTNNNNISNSNSSSNNNNNVNGNCSSNMFDTNNLLSSTNNNLNTNCIRNNSTNGLSTATNHAKRKHESSGTRLDAMVRRLADKQKEKEAREASPPPTAWASQFIEQLNFYNIIRSVATVSQPTIFPAAVTKAVLSDTSGCQKNESTSDAAAKLEDIGSEIVQQTSDDSSPSPSDSSNNVDDFAFNVNDLAEKPFTCEHANCHKRFANKFLLKKHQFIHTGLRPHCCPFCGKRFNRKDNLLRHKKTHSAPMAATGTKTSSAAMPMFTAVIGCTDI